MRVRVTKGGWRWLGIVRNVGDEFDAPSPEWVANRIADGGLVEVIPEQVNPIETAALTFTESATLPSQRASAKQRKR